MDVQQATGCPHLPAIVSEIEPSVDQRRSQQWESLTQDEKDSLVDEVAKLNVLRTVKQIVQRSSAIRTQIENGQAMVVGALYDVTTGEIDFFADESAVQQHDVVSTP